MSDDVIDATLVEDGTWSVGDSDSKQPDLFPTEILEADKRDNTHYVYKRNELIHGSFSLSAFALKTLSVLISRIDPRSTDGKMPSFEFSVIEFAQMLKVSRQRVYEVIEEVTDELQSQLARLPLRDFEYEKALREEKRLAKEEERKPRAIPRPIVDPRSFEKVNWFHKSTFDASTGKIKFIFHEDMAPYLRDFSGYFTKYSPDHILDMRSFHSIRLYEILRSLLPLKNIERGKREIFRTVEYTKLRAWLNLEDKYPRFSSFETRVLKQAQKELKDSDLSFEYSLPERTKPNSRARITKILFKIRARNRDQDYIALSTDTGKAATLLQTKDLQKLIVKYGDDQVSRNLTYVEEELDKGFEPNCIKRFTVSCIKRDIESTDGALNPYSYSDKSHRAFITEKLMQIWDTLPQESRIEFVTHRFRKGLVAQLYKAYEKETGQASISDLVMGAVENDDIDW